MSQKGAFYKCGAKVLLSLLSRKYFLLNVHKSVGCSCRQGCFSFDGAHFAGFRPGVAVRTAANFTLLRAEISSAHDV